jgi:hypothetical protein
MFDRPEFRKFSSGYSHGPHSLPITSKRSVAFAGAHAGERFCQSCRDHTGRHYGIRSSLL